MLGNCRKLGAPKVFYIAADMASPEAPEHVVQFALDKLGEGRGLQWRPGPELGGRGSSYGCLRAGTYGVLGLAGRRLIALRGGTLDRATFNGDETLQD